MKRAVILAAVLLPAGVLRAQKTSLPKVSCQAENFPEVVTNAHTKKAEERDNWRVNCTIKRGDEVIHSGRLVLPYPASFREAMDAIDEFRTKKAPEILKKPKEKP
jgi:hypothetical protein